MIELTSEAREVLDRYLKRMRLSLGGTSLEADEVERDVRAHIEEALAGRGEPVGSADLTEVLERLGSPTQWVPEEEISYWRRALARLAEGPEDWRLAYWCFGLTIVGLVTLPLGVGIFILAGAVFLSRAAIAVSEERDEQLGAKRWLIYPVLVFFSVMVLMIPVLLPVGGMIAFVSETWPDESVVYGVLGVDDSVAELVAMIIAFTGAWWILLAGIAAMAAKPIRQAFVPLTNGFRPKHATWLGLTGFVLVVGSGAMTLLL